MSAILAAYLIGGLIFIVWAAHPKARVEIPTSGLILLTLFWPAIVAFGIVLGFARVLRGGA